MTKVSFPAAATALPTGVYIPSGSLTGPELAAWRAAKAASGSTPAIVAFHGDSVCSGQNASDPMSTSALELIRKYLTVTQGYTLYGDYYPAWAWSSQSSLGGALPWSGILNAASVAAQFAYAWHKLAQTQAGTGAIAVQTFTTPYACTEVDLHWVDFFTCDWNYNVDGGANVPVAHVSGSNPGTQANTVIRKAAIAGLANTTHTVSYGFGSAQDLMVLGASTIKNATGIGFARMCYPGHSLIDYKVAGTQFPNDRKALFQGKTPNSDASTNTGYGFPLQPHLAIIQTGLNECSAGSQAEQANSSTKDASFEGNLSCLIDALRRGQPGCSIILVASCYPNGVNSDISVTGFANPTIYYQYLKAIRNVAQARNCVMVNIHDRWGQTPLTQGFMAGTNLHPTDAGYADIAAAITPLL